MKKRRSIISDNVKFDNNEDYSEVTEICGSLRCFGATVPRNAFPKLTSVGGSLDCRNAILSDDAFPQLRTVVGSFHGTEGTVSDNALPQLVQVGGSFYITDSIVSRKAFPKMSSIGGSLFMEGENLPDTLMKAKTRTLMRRVHRKPVPLKRETLAERNFLRSSRR